MKPLDEFEIQLSEKEYGIITAISRDHIAIDFRGKKGKEHGRTILNREGIKELIDLLQAIESEMDSLPEYE